MMEENREEKTDLVKGMSVNSIPPTVLVHAEEQYKQDQLGDQTLFNVQQNTENRSPIYYLRPPSQSNPQSSLSYPTNTQCASTIQSAIITTDLIRELIKQRKDEQLAEIINRGRYRCIDTMNGESLLVTIAITAIELNYLPPLNLLLLHYYPFTAQHLQLAIEKGSIKVASWLIDQGVPPNQQTIHRIVSVGPSDLVERLAINGVNYTTYHLLLAAESDNLDIYRLLFDLGVKDEQNVCLVAGPRVLRWICDNRRVIITSLISERVLELIDDPALWGSLYGEGRVNYNDRSLSLAIERGDLRAIKWLYSIGLAIRPIHSVEASKVGSLRLLDWFAYMNAPIDPFVGESPHQEVRDWYQQYQMRKTNRKSLSWSQGTIVRRQLANKPIQNRERSNTSFISSTRQIIE